MSAHGGLSDCSQWQKKLARVAVALLGCYMVPSLDPHFHCLPLDCSHLANIEVTVVEIALKEWDNSLDHDIDHIIQTSLALILEEVGFEAVVP
jgi:hypothetical protein